MNPILALFLALVLAGIDKPKQELPSDEVLSQEVALLVGEAGEGGLDEDEEELGGGQNENDDEVEGEQSYYDEGELWDDDLEVEEGGVIWEEVEVDPDWWNADLQEVQDPPAQDEIWEGHQGSEREVMGEDENVGVQGAEPEADVIKAQVAWI